MPQILEKDLRIPAGITCIHCEGKLNASYYYEVDRGVVCDGCFEEHYSHMEKCSTEDCIEYDDPENFRNGMCEPCLEVLSPLEPEEQEGWEDNITRWNED